MTLAALAIVFVALVAQRLVELRVARRHTAALRARGGREFGADHYRWMVAMHAAWFAVWLVEIGLRGVRLWWGSAVCAMVALLAEALRQWSVRTLGARWTTRVLAVPGESPIHSGPYRWLRHPNYVAVFAQLVSVPLVFGCFIAPIFGALSYAWVLRARLRAEEEALQAMRDLPAGAPAGAAPGTGYPS